jgi:hypothetical protein
LCGGVAALLLAAAVALLPVRDGAAQPVDEVVDLELVLAVDVSWSMDYDEQILQRAGYIAAFRHPEVIAAIESGDWGRIAVTYVEWAGTGSQQVKVPWRLIDGADTASAFADELAATTISRMRRTSISSALDYVGGLFGSSGFEGMRRTVDVSGDGPNNMGRSVVRAREELLGAGVTINGLPIMIKGSTPGGYFNMRDLDIYYEDCVIGGFGAFMITVDDPAQLAEAIRRKLVLEIASAAPVAIPAQARSTPSPRIDCLVGERQWQEWQGNRWQ